MGYEKMRRGMAFAFAAVFTLAFLTGCSDRDPGDPTDIQWNIEEQDEQVQKQQGSSEEFSEENVRDFKEDYDEITGECVLTYATESEVRDMLNHGTGVVLFTWTGCPWCHQYVRYLNTTAGKYVGKVLCYDIYSDREEDTEFYRFVVDKIGSFLAESEAYDSSGKLRIYVPELVFVVKGEVIAHDNETSMIGEGEADPETYWDESDKNGITRSANLIERLCGPFRTVCAALDEIDSRGCDSCVAVRPSKKEGADFGA